MREAITDDAIQYYSAWRERGNRPLFETKIIKVIYGKFFRVIVSVTYCMYSTKLYK